MPRPRRAVRRFWTFPVFLLVMYGLVVLVATFVVAVAATHR